VGVTEFNSADLYKVNNNNFKCHKSFLPWQWKRSFSLLWYYYCYTPTFFAPPSARRNFFKCAPPPNLKSWIRPCDDIIVQNELVLNDRKKTQINVYRNCFSSINMRRATLQWISKMCIILKINLERREARKMLGYFF
jgi:hypothetical protein